MMTTPEMIGKWFDIAKDQGSKYLLIVCDRYDWEDYPVTALDREDCFKQIEAYNGPNMQKVMEVYDLSLDKQLQLNQPICWNVPKS